MGPVLACGREADCWPRPAADLNGMAPELPVAVPSGPFRHVGLSKAARTHRLRKLRTPAKCRECNSYVYFQGAECEEVGRARGTAGATCSGGSAQLGAEGSIWRPQGPGGAPKARRQDRRAVGRKSEASGRKELGWQAQARPPSRGDRVSRERWRFRRRHEGVRVGRALGGGR